MSQHGNNIIFLASYWLPEKAEMLFERIVNVPEVTPACPWIARAIQVGQIALGTISTVLAWQYHHGGSKTS